MTTKYRIFVHLVDFDEDKKNIILKSVPYSFFEALPIYNTKLEAINGMILELEEFRDDENNKVSEE